MMSPEEMQPVTLIVSRVVRPGHEAEYEAWIRGITADALRFPGHQGAHIIRPNDHQHPEYVIIFRFDTYDHLKAWEESDVRQQWRDRLRPLTVGEDRIEHQTGLEFWFTPSRPGMPKRYKQALLSWLMLFPLVLLVSPVVGRLGLPGVLRTMVQTAVLIALMSYVVMPRATRVFSRWMF